MNFFEVMTISILDIISELWNDEKLPIINGLVKADGSFYEIKVEDCQPVTADYQPSTFDVTAKNYYEWYSSVLGSPFLTHAEITYYCGECSQGSDGFLLAVNNKNNTVEWLFFDEEANPLEKMWVENDEIHAMSNLNIEWIFPINAPEKLRSINHGF